MHEFAGTKFRIIAGYGSGFEVARGLETGEVEAWCGWSISGIRARYPNLLRDGKVRPVVQFTLAEAGARMNIARASEHAVSADAAEALRAIESQTLFGGFALAASPRTTPSRLAELRAAFDAMLHDPEALADAGRMGLDIDGVSGAEMQQEADRITALPASTLNLLRRVLQAR